MDFFDRLNSYIVTNDYRSLFPHITPTTFLGGPLITKIIEKFRGDDPDLIEQLYETGVMKYRQMKIFDLMEKPRMLAAYLRREPNHDVDDFATMALAYHIETFVVLYEIRKIAKSQIYERYHPLFDAFIAARDSIRLTSCILLYIGRKKRQKDAFLIISRVVWSKRGDGN